MKFRSFNLVLLALLTLLAAATHVFAEDEVFTATVTRYPYQIPNTTVIGSPTWIKVKKGDTLLDIARRNGLGWNSIEDAYPKLDAWVPPVGLKLSLPTTWILPPSQHYQLVINIPELRIYFFEKGTSQVQTYPIGIGDEGWESPLGTFSIVERRTNPTWYIPASLQEKYGMASMPPGPENPLGEFMLKFSAGAYGVHGTAQPWGVGRLVSHGCIRCYPEHIKLLFPQVPIGTKLEIIYEPLKIGQRNGHVFVEAHSDVYQKIPNYSQYAEQKLAQCPYADRVDRRRFTMALNLRSGVPTDVTKSSYGDTSLKVVDLTQE